SLPLRLALLAKGVPAPRQDWPSLLAARHARLLCISTVGIQAMETMLAGWLGAGGGARGAPAGVLVAWLVMRGKLDPHARGTAERQAGMQGELATLRERAGMLEEERGQRQAELEQLRSQTGAMRDELDLARDERAQWQERAQRLPQLEQALVQEQARLEQAR